MDEPCKPGRSGRRRLQMGIDQPVKVASIPESREMSNQFGQAVDSNGRTHVVVRHNDGTSSTQSYYYYTRGNLIFHPTKLNITGKRPKIYCDSSNTLWLVCNTDGGLDIYAAKASENWSTWRQAYSNSDGATFINEFTGLLEGSKLYVMAQRTGAGNASSLFVYELNLSQK